MIKGTMSLVLLWFVLAIPVSLEAQGIGGRLRQRAQETVSGKKEAEQTEVDRSKIFTGDVLEITEAAMKGFMIGLETEYRLLTEFAALLDTYKSPEDFQQCKTELPSSPEAMEIMARMGNMSANATDDDIRRAIEKMNEDMVALQKQKCGGDVTEDWPNTKRDEKLREIGVKAAAAAIPVRPPEPRPTGGPSPLDDESYIAYQQQQGMTFQQYIIFKERVNAYCAYKKLKGDNMLVTPGDGWNLSFSAKALDAKAGNVSWVFTADEIKVMDDHCDGVVLEIGKITMILEMAPINIYGKTK